MDRLEARWVFKRNLENNTVLLWNSLDEKSLWEHLQWMPTGYTRCVIDRTLLIDASHTWTPKEKWRLLDRAARTAVVVHKSDKDNFEMLRVNEVTPKKMRGWDLFS